LLSDPTVVADVRALLEGRKAIRRYEQTIRAIEKDEALARLAQERETKEQEKENLRLAELSLATGDKSLRYWEALGETVDAATKALGLRFRELDHYPMVRPYQLSMLDRKLAGLRDVIHYLEVHLRGRDERTAVGEPVIDV